MIENTIAKILGTDMETGDNHLRSQAVDILSLKMKRTIKGQKNQAITTKGRKESHLSLQV